MLLDAVSLTRLSIGRMSYLDPSNLVVTDAGYLSSFGCPQVGGLVEFGDRLSPDSIREYRTLSGMTHHALASRLTSSIFGHLVFSPCA